MRIRAEDGIKVPEPDDRWTDALLAMNDNIILLADKLVELMERVGTLEKSAGKGQ